MSFTHTEGDRLMSLATSLAKMTTLKQMTALLANECQKALEADAVCLFLLQKDDHFEMVSEKGCSEEFKNKWRHVPKEWIPIASVPMPEEALVFDSADKFKLELPVATDLIEKSGRKM